MKEATLLLMDHMCHNMAHSTPVIMTMEISPQHHAIVIGKVKSVSLIYPLLPQSTKYLISPLHLFI